MRILVTGGAGFIGSNYVRMALSGALSGHADDRITVLDKLTYSGNRDNLGDFAYADRLDFVVGDICDERLVDDVLPDHDAVVHFAAETHVDRSIACARPFVTTNVLGTQVLLDAALRHGTGRFVHVSTDEVYGSTEHGSWTEDSPLSPSSPYSASKAASDLLAMSYHRTHGLDVVITRCSNNYGHWQYPEKVVPLFITNLLDGRRVPLYGDGGNMRDWLHVDDHVRGIDLVLRRGRAGEIYHIGGGIEMTNKELTSRLLEAVGAGWDMVDHVPDRKGHDRRYALSIDKISAELGYRGEVELSHGLSETVRWYRENRDWWEALRKRDVAP